MHPPRGPPWHTFLDASWVTFEGSIESQRKKGGQNWYFWRFLAKFAKIAKNMKKILFGIERCVIHVNILILGCWTHFQSLFCDFPDKTRRWWTMTIHVPDVGCSILWHVQRPADVRFPFRPAAWCRSLPPDLKGHDTLISATLNNRCIPYMARLRKP